MASYKIVIDVRMINSSGIGRYIRSLIPALINLYGRKEIALMGLKEELVEFSWFSDKLSVIRVDSKIYSISEQFELFLKIPKCEVYISPHYNVPLFSGKPQKFLFFFPDVNHLVITNGIGILKKIYAYIMYNLGAIKASVIFTISDFSEMEIRRKLYINPKRIEVAKCGVDFEYLNSFSNKSNLNITEPYLLYVGNVKPHKNLKRSIEAFERVCRTETDLKFVIVGKREGFLTGDNSIDKTIKSLNLEGRVEFTGYVTDEELISYYKNAEFLFFASLYEGFGLPPLEAMALSCPVIVSNTASLPEICGDAAVYVNPYDVEDMSKTILELLSNNKLQDDLRTKGLERVKKFSWEDFNNQVVAYLKEQ